MGKGFLTLSIRLYSYSKPSTASPHHTILLADPQLVDPHTYPGRPWPLSTLTIRHTDLYLKRSFSELHQRLDPDTLFFLGDLFDGGREWGTSKSSSPEKRWRKYGEQYWLAEYERFGNIFLDRWITVDRPNRKIIADLPGNHDLGLGNRIQLPVKARFNAFFGTGNRIDIIANHTFVSVDTVSLSAKGQAEVSTEFQGEGAPNAKIWAEVDSFLSNAKIKKQAAIARHLHLLSKDARDIRADPQVIDIMDPAARLEPNLTYPLVELPSILLTHVPLYRAPGTPCGPLREHWPPSRKANSLDELPDKDDANAISVSAGYQYQNVLLPIISTDLVEKVGDVQYVFSGDDHDYCEIVHRGFTSRGGGIREITVKSMSWAMGVRKPGFLMLSLWNPLDLEGNSITVSEDNDLQAHGRSGRTLQAHLCLLPDQLAVFFRYAVLLGITLSALGLRAFFHVYVRPSREKEEDQLLPYAKPRASQETRRRDRDDSYIGSSSSNSSDLAPHTGLAARSSTGRTRASSPIRGYGIPIAENVSSMSNEHLLLSNRTNHPIWGREDQRLDNYSQQGGVKGIVLVYTEFKKSVWNVASVALIWYLLLVWIS
ncbi:hypothetical protein MMC20_004369 [Loxospora ochrophaea]|nr:hypothetical protein [Loxospora ochrophaea]